MSKESRLKLFDNLLSQEEIAQELGVHPRTVANWMSSGKMPCVRIGRKNMALRRSVEIWIEQQKPVKKSSTKRNSVKKSSTKRNSVKKRSKK